MGHDGIPEAVDQDGRARCRFHFVLLIVMAISHAGLTHARKKKAPDRGGGGRGHR